VATENNTVALSNSFTQLLSPREDSVDGVGELSGQAALSFGAEFATQAMKLADCEIGPLTVGLIDCYRFSRECLMTVLEGLNPHLVVAPFPSVQSCIEENQKALDLIIYYPHAGDGWETAIARDVGAIRQAAPVSPIVVLSDVEDTHQPETIRSVLSSGAHGFIPTRTTGVLVAVAALRFVKSGGTFAPLDQLLTNRLNRGTTPPEATQQNPLTSRQTAVLSLLQQGKANKIIAYELNMSESTVKVHIRNIMRKMGATNRTQVAYKARQLWGHKELGTVSN
jgi:DNA-binding NarL/FixJ family response regulator